MGSGRRTERIATCGTGRLEFLSPSGADDAGKEMITVLVKFTIDEQDCWNCDHFSEIPPWCKLFKKHLRNKRTNKTDHAFRSIRSRKCWIAQRTAERINL